MLKKKKGQSGNAAQYLTRNQALKKLQLKLAEFRRLCILKGIHPREPKKKVQGAHKTYYHVKDIAFLQHEPLLNRVRELHAYQKKIRKALAKRNKDLATRLKSRQPTYRLDHLVRERYPSFIDAVRDLDDPLTLVHLFAVLPSDDTKGIPVDQLVLSRRLALEWQAWVVRNHALRKVFVSVKGYYYQAEVMGQTVTWLVPHQLAQVLPNDVDFRVMLTFVELYQTTLRFVLYKLYHDSGMKYPPMPDKELDDGDAGIEAIMKTLGGAVEVIEGEPPAVNAGKINSLNKRVKQLEEEIKSMGDAGGSDEEDEDEDDDEDGEDLQIDSGDEDEEEDEEVDDDDDDELVDDPSDDDIPLPTTANDSDDDEDDVEEDAEDGNTTTAAHPLVGGAADVDADDDEALCSTLFRGMRFFLGREVPKEQLLLVIRSFGGQVGWDGAGSPYSENDDRITHHVVDRPTLGKRFLTREYVQPQWVFDSANARVLVRAELYVPGIAPPPHLSPFVKADEEGYVPEYGKEIAQLQEAARAARRRASARSGEAEFLETNELPAITPAALSEEAQAAAAERQYAAELAEELKAAGHAVPKFVTKAAVNEEAEDKQPAVEQLDEDEEEARLNPIMMSRKVRRQYTGAMKQKAAKKQRVEELQKKAKALKSSK